MVLYISEATLSVRAMSFLQQKRYDTLHHYSSIYTAEKFWVTNLMQKMVRKKIQNIFAIPVAFPIRRVWWQIQGHNYYSL